MNGLLAYWPGTSWLHRAPASAKLAVLLAVSSVVVWWSHPIASAAVTAAAVVCVGSAGVPARVLVRAMTPFVVMAAAVLAAQTVWGSAEAGIVASLRMVAVASVAVAVTLTTPAAAVVDLVERTLTRLRVPPARVFRMGLLVSVALRSIDHLGWLAARVQDARHARGLHRSPRALAVPMVVGAGRFAHGVGEALDARGVADPDPDPHAGVAPASAGGSRR